jgi:hypothetical protein
VGRPECAALLIVLGAASSASGAAPVERLARERVFLEYERGSLGHAEAGAFADLLDQGVADLEGLLLPALPVSARRAGPLRVIVGSEVPFSRTYGRTVRLPLERVKTRTAPYLHELVHALLPARSGPVWLSEGLACYLESWVSENRGGYDAHVFTPAGDREIHGAARRWLSRAKGRAVLPWVGEPGEPPNLERDRVGVARPFYVLAHSFTKHLVEEVGLERVVRLLADGDGATLEHRTGRSASEWRREWLETLAAA